jgi:hypothetical protein
MSFPEFLFLFTPHIKNNDLFLLFQVIVIINTFGRLAMNSKNRRKAKML